MTRPLSNDLRSRAVAAVAGGMSCRAVAVRFGVAASTVVKWVGRWRATGTWAPRPQGGDKRSGRVEAHGEEILGLIAEKVDITLAEIAAHLEHRQGERFAPSTIWRFLDRHGMTFKKNRARQRARPCGRGSREAGLVRRPA
jgi:transposase